MHNAALSEMALDWVYVPFDVDPAEAGSAVAAVRALKMVGVNVTVPLKETIAPFLDMVDPAAMRAGSVNTIHNVEGELRGYSTDGPGFIRAITRLGWSVEGKTVYMLGAGGSARAVAFALVDAGARVVIANRTAEKALTLANAVNAHYPGTTSTVDWSATNIDGDVALVVNTTSLGMHPREDEWPPVPAALLDPSVRFYDLIYAPEETAFLRRAREAGCSTANGLDMLVQQGALSLSIWTGIAVDDLPVAEMEKAVRRTGD
jgi:shikimate dehydrogenase